MANPFVTVINNMRDMGMFQFLMPWLLTTAIFYGLLRKSQIFGSPERSVTVNGVVATVAAFMVWSAPIILGVDLETKMASFFVQGTMATLVVLVGLMIVSMFFPENLGVQMGELLKTKAAIGALIAFGMIVAFAILITSGMIYFFVPEDFFSSVGFGGWGGFGDALPSILMVVLLLGSMLLIVWGGGKAEK